MTFELSCPRRLTLHAVAGQLERGVRQHSRDRSYER
jgi:hypothetical protein